MPIRFVCKNISKKLKQGEIRDQAGNCFKKGIKVGFAVGINKALKKQAKIKPILQELKEKPPTLKSTKPSLTTLIENRPNKATRVRDFLTTLPIKNKDLQMSTKKKKELNTEGLKQYLINTGEYRR
jgi:hypothetical protein